MGENKEKNKLKFPCNICSGDNITHQCPQMDEIRRDLARQGAQ